MGKIAMMFPGQGSQKVGMGWDIYQKYPCVKEIIHRADSITGEYISKLCFDGPIEKLTLTSNVQPAITAVSLAYLKLLLDHHIRPDIVLGHSLGEISALCASGMISVENALKIAAKRGELMQREAEKHPGVMYAITGLTIDEILEIVTQSQQQSCVSVANYNLEKQIVVSGELKAVTMIICNAREKGAKATPLLVSGAWHSPLMKGAEQEFYQFLLTMFFQDPSVKIILNRTGDYEGTACRIKASLSQQLTNPVLWYESVKLLQKEDISYYLEVGGNVLSGINRKILPGEEHKKIFSIYDLISLANFLKVFDN